MSSNKRKTPPSLDNDNTTEMSFTSITKDIGYLRRDLKHFMSQDYETSCIKSKIDEISNFTPKQDKSYYENMVYIGSIDDLDPVIEFCESPIQHDIWEFYRVFTSSISTRKGFGRLIRFLVKDKSTAKYIGIAALGEDLLMYHARDKVINWNDDARLQNLEHVMNIVCCVPLQPFGYNYNGGKLILAACFSDEVRNHFQQKYNTDLVMLNTFSINGKSVLYDRLPFVKYVGKTNGCVPAYIPDHLLAKGLSLMKAHNIPEPSRIGRFFKLKAIFSFLKMKLDDIMNSGRERGVYLGFTGSAEEGMKLLNNMPNAFKPIQRSFKSLFDGWKARWALQRSRHLLLQNKFRPMVPEFQNPKTEKHIKSTQASVQAKKELIGEEAYNMQKAEYQAEYRKGVKFNLPPPTDLKPINLAYLAGFVDGDGCIGIGKNRVVNFSISQCDPSLLKNISWTYGASIRMRPKDGKKRAIFIVELAGHFVKNIINDIKDLLVLKSTHANAILEILDAMDHIDEPRILRTLEILQVPWKDTTKYYDRVSWDYTAGLFDAEGCILMSKKNMLTCSITQASDLGVLTKIAEFTGFGHIEKSGVRLIEFSKERIKNFLTQVLPLLHTKKSQAILALEMLDDERPSDKRVAEIRELIGIEKHKNFEKEAFVTGGDGGNCFDMKKLRKTLNPIVKTMEKAARDQANNEATRDRMTGAGNPNFGVERSALHSSRIAEATLKKCIMTRNITDQQIDDIRAELLKGKLSHEKLGEKYGFCRQYIGDIGAGKVLKSTEITPELIAKRAALSKAKRGQGVCTKEEFGKRAAIGKRKVPASKILEIIKYRKANPSVTPSSIANMHAGVSADMVKNYTNGKTKLLESEFPIEETTWEQYCELMGITQEDTSE